MSENRSKLLLKERLRELRDKRNMTQDDVATAVGKQRSDIAAYESKSKKNTPPIETLSNLADLFNVSIDYLTGRSDEPHQIYAVSEDMTPEQKHVIFRVTELMKDDLSEDDLASAVEFFEFLQMRNAKRKNN